MPHYTSCPSQIKHGGLERALCRHAAMNISPHDTSVGPCCLRHNWLRASLPLLTLFTSNIPANLPRVAFCLFDMAVLHAVVNEVYEGDTVLHGANNELSTCSTTWGLVSGQFDRVSLCFLVQVICVPVVLSPKSSFGPTNLTMPRLRDFIASRFSESGQASSI